MSEIQKVRALLGMPFPTAEVTLLNVSYDPTRELYLDYNAAFAKYWKGKTGQDVRINQSHGGSTAQARSIMEGLEADVVTFNFLPDVQVLHDKANLIPADWQKRLPNNSSPYYSFPAFLVRGGNPKNITDWDDLVRPDVKLVFPNPKTSGNSKYTYLAAYAYARHKYGSDAAADDFVKVFTKEGYFLKNKTMSHFERVLDPLQFVRSHRSYIINLQQITRIDPYEKDSHVAILRSGAKVPVSRTGYPKLRSILGL